MSSATWETLKEQGNDAFKARSYEEAIQLYSAAIAAKPDEVVLYSNRSAAFLKKGNLAEAENDARKAVTLDVTFTRGYSRLHTALCNQGRFADCIQEMKVGLGHMVAAGCSPQDVKQLRELLQSAEMSDNALKRATKLVAAGDNDGGVRSLGAALEAFPECPQVAFLFAECNAAASPERSGKVLSGFAHSHCNDPYYLYLRALVLYYRGQDGFGSAQSILRQALEMDPDNGKARVLLKKIRNVENRKEAGNTHFKQKRAKEAVDEYTTAIDLDPDNARMNAVLRGNRAAARMEMKDFKGALLDCDYAIRNGTAVSKLYARRSRINENLEKFDDALRDMQHAAEEDTSFAAELRQLKARVKRAKRKDYYKILGVSPNERDEAAIKRAYKRACLQWHPDKWAHTSEEEKTQAEAQFKEIGEAFNVLSDPQKKRLYDSGQLDNDVEGASPAGFSGGYGGADQEDVIRMMNMMFGGGGGGFSQQQGFSNMGGGRFSFQHVSPGMGGGRQQKRGGFPF